MAFVITILILFAFTLLTPGLASIVNEEQRAQAALRRVAAEERAAAAAKAAAKNKLEEIEAEEKLLEIKIARLEAEEKLAVEQGRATGTIIANIQRQKAALEDFRKSNKELTEELNEAKNAADNFAGSFVSNLQGMMGLQHDYNKSIIGSFSLALKNGESLGQIYDKLKDKMMKGFTIQQVGYNTLKKFAEMTFFTAKAQDAAISSFIRATGVGEGYDDVITDTFFDLRTLGVSMEEAGVAATSLYIEMAAFTTLSRDTQAELVSTVALMNEFGVSTDVSAQALDTMTKGLGMSALEAANMSERLVQMAENIGVPPARLMQELSTTAPQLAKWGDQAIEVFLELQGAAKATGISMGNLISIAEGFDTFEGAAEAAGRLNAVLGGPYLNSIELLNANEEDRIRMLIQSVELSGQSWESMGRFQRQAVASAAGITDMSDANRIFGQSLSEYETAQREAELTADAQRELQERALEAQTVYEMMTAAMNSFAISMRPVVEFMKGFFEGLAKFMDYVSEHPFLKAIMFVVASLTVALVGFGALGAMASTVASGLTFLTTAFAGTTGAVGAFTIATRVLMGLTGIGLLITMLGGLAAIFKPASPPWSKHIKDTTRELNEFGRTANRITSDVRDLAAPTTAIAVSTGIGGDVGVGGFRNAQNNLISAKVGATIGGAKDNNVARALSEFGEKFERGMKQKTILKVNNREYARQADHWYNDKFRTTRGESH